MRTESTSARRVMQVILLCIMVTICLAAGVPNVHDGRVKPGEDVVYFKGVPWAIAVMDKDGQQTFRPEMDSFRILRRSNLAQTPVHDVHPLSSRGGTMVTESPWLPFRATWYSSFDGGGQGTITATGSHVQDNWTVAVDPHVIPLGSVIQVRFANGTVHTFQALDTGGAIVGNHIDIFQHSREQCIKNGVQAVQLRILVKGKR